MVIWRTMPRSQRDEATRQDRGYGGVSHLAERRERPATLSKTRDSSLFAGLYKMSSSKPRRLAASVILSSASGDRHGVSGRKASRERRSNRGSRPISSQ